MSTPNIPQKEPYGLDMKAGTYYWCSCGQSSKQPFCDGSHKGSDFTPQAVEIKEDKTIYWCGCKHSKMPGFCDGSHKSL